MYYTLSILQQPKQARQCSGRDKIDRRPIDPPPILQIHSNSPTHDGDEDINDNSQLHFINVKLVDSASLLPIENYKPNSVLNGGLSQTTQLIKDLNNQIKNLILFQDLSVRVEGIFKLKFTHFIIKDDVTIQLSSTYSTPFQVFNPKSFPGMMESTLLTRLCASQGIKIRVRMQSRRNSNNINNNNLINNNNNNINKRKQSLISSIYNPTNDSLAKEEGSPLSISSQTALNTPQNNNHSTFYNESFVYQKYSLNLPMITIPSNIANKKVNHYNHNSYSYNGYDNNASNNEYTIGSLKKSKAATLNPTDNRDFDKLFLSYLKSIY